MTEETNEPPPLVRTNVRNFAMEDALADQEAEDRQSWELEDAQDKAKELRGIFSNRVYVAPDGKHLRIAFGEKVGDETIYHTAIVMPLEEALDCGQLLTNMASQSLSLMLEHYRAVLSGLEVQGGQQEAR